MEVKTALSYGGVIIFSVVVTLFFTNNTKQESITAETQESLLRTINALETSVTSLNQSINKLQTVQSGLIPNKPMQDSFEAIELSETNNNTGVVTLDSVTQVMEDVVESKLQDVKLNTNLRQNTKHAEPTAEQVGKFEQMQREIADPIYNSEMTFSSLVQTMDENELPKPMRKQLLEQAVQMLNSGELDPASFMQQ